MMTYKLLPLLNKFGRKGDLQYPNCPVYLFKGLHYQDDSNKIVLAGHIAGSPQILSIAPANWICVTSTKGKNWKKNCHFG